jgi:Tfp pilus assembly protein PilF
MKFFRRIVVLVLVVFILSTNLCYGQSIVKQYLTKGVGYAVKGKFKEAKKEFEKALELDPFNETRKLLLKVIEDGVEKKIDQKTAVYFFKGVDYAIKLQWFRKISTIHREL